MSKVETKVVHFPKDFYKGEFKEVQKLLEEMYGFPFRNWEVVAYLIKKYKTDLKRRVEEVKENGK